MLSYEPETMNHVVFFQSLILKNNKKKGKRWRQRNGTIIPKQNKINIFQRYSTQKKVGHITFLLPNTNNSLLAQQPAKGVVVYFQDFRIQFRGY